MQDIASKLMHDHQQMMIEHLTKENEYLRYIVENKTYSVDFQSKTWHAFIDCMTLLVKCKHPNELLTHPNEQIRVLTKCLLGKDPQ